MRLTRQTSAMITGHVDRPINRFCRWDGKTHKEIVEEHCARQRANTERLKKVEDDVRDVQAQIERLANEKA